MSETPTTPVPTSSTGPISPDVPDVIRASDDDPVLELLNRLSTPVEMEVSADNRMIRHEIRCVSLTVAELKMAIARNPNHPVAGVYASAVKNLPDTHQVSVEQPDLQALIQNSKVKVEFHDRAGQRVKTKRCE